VGDKLEWFISLQSEGRVIPILDEMPLIEDYAHFYWVAFNVLSGSRRIGMGNGSIPLSEIRGYCDEYLIKDVESRIFLIEVVSELDSFYLSESNKKSEKGSKK
jgi:hypothetical protein